MGLFDNININNIGDKLSNISNQVSGFAKDSTEQLSITAEISNLRNQVRQHQQVIGELYYRQMRQGGDGLGIDEECETIAALLQQIANKEDRIAQIKAQVTCLGCGKPIPGDSSFCPHCGTAIPSTSAQTSADAEAMSVDSASDDVEIPALSIKALDATSYTNVDESTAISVNEVIANSLESVSDKLDTSVLETTEKVVGNAAISSTSISQPIPINDGDNENNYDDDVNDYDDEISLVSSSATPIVPRGDAPAYSRHCPKCGAVLLETSKFCMTCGERF